MFIKSYKLVYLNSSRKEKERKEGEKRKEEKERGRK